MTVYRATLATCRRIAVAFRATAAFEFLMIFRHIALILLVYFVIWSIIAAVRMGREVPARMDGPTMGARP